MLKCSRLVVPILVPLVVPRSDASSNYLQRGAFLDAVGVHKGRLCHCSRQRQPITRWWLPETDSSFPLGGRLGTGNEQTAPSNNATAVETKGGTCSCGSCEGGSTVSCRETCDCRNMLFWNPDHICIFRLHGDRIDLVRLHVAITTARCFVPRRMEALKNCIAVAAAVTVIPLP